MIKDRQTKESERPVTRDVKVFSTIAVQSALEALVPQFETANGCRLEITWNTAPALVKRLQGGETADVLILNRAGMDAMMRDGRVLAGSEVTLASSATALAVKAGAPRPDISTPQALTRTLLEARAISYSDPAAGGASGIYFAKLVERLGIAAEINAKTKYPPPAGLCADLLVSGEVELAVQQKPELLQVRGIEILGLLPGDLHMVTVFVACVEASSAEPATGKALIDFLRSPASMAVFRAKGLDTP
ncbi:molybdate ABC transporter substrate-binding protein [Reyranella soli]|jgi:molybdate transport system substrate-binding protein|uniref:Molybdate ABC transporter substrate-binding protein n=1 Tax=Reyranella soli TaxID=1230389 RepID=A0A512NAJ7_9HYPH|nr:substrate-binding domain-containing protein [Reyranella soli]GEP55711.1 molybdate ABC transporter substrate-binding protein [Reyranella soli]